MATIQELADKLEIIQVIQRYAQLVDDKRFDLLGTVFTEDAHLVYLIGKHLIERTMPDACDTFRAFLTKCWWTSHLTSSPVIDLNGDEAYASSRVTATHIQICKDGTRNIWILSGAYEDELVRHNAGWRIRKRVANVPCEQGSFRADGVREFPSAPSVQSSV